MAGCPVVKFLRLEDFETRVQPAADRAALAISGPGQSMETALWLESIGPEAAKSFTGKTDDKQ